MRSARITVADGEWLPSQAAPASVTGAAPLIDPDSGGRGLGRDILEPMPASVAVRPVQAPPAAVVAQLRDRPTGPLGPGVFPPGSPDLQDCHVRPRDGVLDADLVPGVLGDALGAPTGDLPQVSFRDGHTDDPHTTHRRRAVLHRRLRTEHWIDQHQATTWERAAEPWSTTQGAKQPRSRGPSGRALSLLPRSTNTTFA